MPLISPAQYETFKASGRLPSPKGLALAVIRLLRRDDYQIADLVQLLQSDPAMAGRLLKFANSAAFGRARPVVAIDKAAVLLGAHRVRDLVLGFCILQEFRRGPCEAFDYELFWSRSLATAIASQVLAGHAQIGVEESFTLGLLCDIGILALVSYDCARYREALGRAGGDAEHMLAAEQAVFGTDHRALGTALMADWGLPENLLSAALHAEAPDAGGLADGSRGHKLALALHCARALAELCVARPPERWRLLPNLYAKAAHLGIEPNDFTALADDTVRRWCDWGLALSLQTLELPPFAELLSSVPPGDVAESPAPRSAAALVGVPAAVLGGFAALLNELGYEVNPVANGIDGLMAVLRDRPQLIVVGLDAPELDGASFCRAYRANPLSRETHLMLLGGHDEEERLSAAIEAGADDYLLWPVSAATLRARLRAADKIAHLREQIRSERRSMMRSAGEWAGSHRRLMAAAFTDLLTRLPNRRFGLDFFAAEWRLARGDGRPLACLMVDIDHFKAINDGYGHDAGDAVLAGVAHILAEHCRSEDMVFRYGGEEFCVVCPDTDAATARIVAERIRGGIELESRAGDERGIAVTVSIGIAALSAAHADVDALLKAADGALYRAKQNGRNRVDA